MDKMVQVYYGLVAYNRRSIKQVPVRHRAEVEALLIQYPPDSTQRLLVIPDDTTSL